MPSLDTTILGGLPVTVDFDLCTRDPEVGIFEAYVGTWHITHVSGKRKHNSFITALERQVLAKEKDFEIRILEEYNEQA